MQLLISKGSPFARKVRILARESGMAAQVDEVVVAVSPVLVNAQLVRQNPLSKIPVLLLDDGSSLYDSRVIVEYLQSIAPHAQQPALDARMQALRSQALCDGILDAAVMCRYESAMRPEALRWDAWMDAQRRKIDAGLTELEAQSHDWGDAFALPQICAVCVLGYLDYRFSDWTWRSRHPHLAVWFAAVSQRPSVTETVPTDA